MVVAFYFRLHLAYFPRPVVAIFARPEQPLKHERRDSLYLSRRSAFSAVEVLLVRRLVLQPRANG